MPFGGIHNVYGEFFYIIWEDFNQSMPILVQSHKSKD